MIKTICMKRKIHNLVHFTDIRHLDSIMRHGLKTRTQVDQMQEGVFPNDDVRLDNHPDSVSLSIEFPNDKMFFKVKNDNPQQQFCIIKVHQQVLWDFDVAFCQKNAASAEIRHQPLHELQTHQAFEGMFSEIAGCRSRVDQKLTGNYPTDVQAEVLVFGRIAPEYIRGVVFPNDQTLADYRHLTEGKTAEVNYQNRGFYGTRTFLLE